MQRTVLTWGFLTFILIGLFLTYVIWQETRSHLHWRRLVAQGDVWAIRELVNAEVERWHSMRPPRGVAVALWAGVQSVELVSVGNDYVQVACGSEGEYRSAGGRREQVSSALDAAMRLAARLIEMLLYDIPEVKLARVRLDVYSTFTVDGLPEQRCILSTVAARQVANELPWEDMSPREIIDRFQSRYATDARGAVIPIEPDPPLPDELAPADSPVSGAERRSSGKDSRPAGRRRAERRSTR